MHTCTHNLIIPKSNHQISVPWHTLSQKATRNSRTTSWTNN